MTLAGGAPKQVAAREVKAEGKGEIISIDLGFSGDVSAQITVGNLMARPARLFTAVCAECELIFDDCRVSTENLVGGEEGQGFRQLMSALETGRINIAARAVGVATAALEAALVYAQQRRAFGVPISQHQAIQLKLAEMATKVQAARLLTYDAAAKKDAGQRVDLEAGMAKLFASEVCAEVALDAMRVHGGYGYLKDFPVERYYRDAPLMIIGEGTNEIQKLIIARRLLEKYKI